MNAMMKARLAYANEFGNPAAKRMVNLPDNPYIFTGQEPYTTPDMAGALGTHYMFSQDNYAIPTIQQGENGQLYYNQNANAADKEAIKFDSPEDAEYFAEHYKEVSPGFINNNYRTGGQFPRPYSLPEDSFKQGGRNLHNSIYASSNAQYPAIYKLGGNINVYKQGGSVLSMSNTPQLQGEGKDLTVPENAYIYAGGGLIKRADGSYSQRGLWDNIRAAAQRNKAVGKPGKQPTKQMLQQEKKINKNK
jgi:hypothetical protein